MMQRYASTRLSRPKCSLHSWDSTYLNAKAFGEIVARPEGSFAAS
jgi:hypothetical protein